MNAPAKFGRVVSLFRSNRNQAVRIPRDMEFPEGVKNLVIRKVGNARILQPKESLWLEYFDQPGVPDFPDRAPQGEYEVRESFD
jgi:antitoxin VapB